MMPSVARIAATLFSSALITATTDAGITTYTDREAWFADVSPGGSVPITTIGFTEFSAGTPITDQYAHLGINFDGQNVTRGEDFQIYPQDGWGLRGLLEIAFTFDEPRQALAVDHPGDMYLRFFSNGSEVEDVYFGTGGSGNLAGVATTFEFDMVIAASNLPPVFFDDLHFVRIPAPGGLFILPGAVFLWRWRVRH